MLPRLSARVTRVGRPSSAAASRSCTSPRYNGSPGRTASATSSPRVSRTARLGARLERRLERDHAVGARNLDKGPEVRAEAAVEDAHHVVGKQQRPGHGHVDAGLVPDRLRGHREGFAGEQPRVAHRVAAHVPQAAAAPLGHQPHVVGTREQEREGPAHRAQAPDAALATMSATCSVSGWWRYMNASATTTPAQRGRVGHPVDVRGHQRHRLLAQHVFAGGNRAERPLHVQVIGQRDVDGVDRRVRQHRVVAAVGGPDLPLGGVAGGALGRTAGHAHQRAACRRTNSGNDRSIDAGRAQQAPPKLSRRHCRKLYQGRAGRRGGKRDGHHVLGGERRR